MNGHSLGLSDPRWPWAPALVTVGVLVLLMGAAARQRRRADRSPELLLARTDRVRALPRYRQLVRRRRSAGLLMTGAALLVVSGTALVLARPQTESVDKRAARGRDIMLCLDASASMDADNVAVIRELKRVVTGLRGDRVGMMIWSGAAVQVFPLTDDYHYVQGQLDRAVSAFSGDPGDFYAGVDLPHRSAVIGDGIVSCVNRFDLADSDRTRAVVLSSGNEPRGTAAYSLPKAAAYAADRDVLVYAIGAASLDEPGRVAAKQTLAAAAGRTGGIFETLDAAGGAPRIVDRINDLEKARASEPPRRLWRDTPYVGMAVSALGVACLLLCWLVAARGLRPRRLRGRR